VDVDIFLPAGVDQCLHHVAGVPVPPVFVQREDAVHFKACRVAGAAGGRSEVSIDEYAEYAFGFRICLLAPVLGPYFLGQGEFSGGELAGGGGGHGDHTILLLVSSTTNALTMKIPVYHRGLILGCVLLVILASGCTENFSSDTNSDKQSGITQKFPEATDDTQYPISVYDGINITNRFFSHYSATPNITAPIYYVLGKEVNMEGKAEQWIFATIIDNESYFIIVESNRQMLVPYQMGIPEGAINIDTILPPNSLITGNTYLIRDTFGKDESFPNIQLELRGNTYTITPSSGNVDRILYFNAFTGMPVIL